MDQKTLESRMQRLSWLLDNSIRLPGGYRVGLDSIIGIVPGVGDVASAGMSFYVIYLAARSGASWWSIGRMIVHVFIETVVGVIPVLGDVFDAAYKANMRNVAILEAQISREGRQQRSHRRLLLTVVLSMVALFMLMIAGLVWLLMRLF